MAISSSTRYNLTSGYNWGDFSTSVFAMTLEAAPDGNVTNVSYSVTNSSVSVTWGPPDIHRRNGVITYYIISWKRVVSLYMNSSYNNIEGNVSSTALNPSATFSGLEAFVNYTIAIYAGNTNFGDPI